MLPFRLIYHDAYDLNLGEHVFPSRKYRIIRDRMVRESFATPEDFVEPEAASDEDVLLVHERDWVQRLKNGTLTYEDIIRMEIPYSRKMIEAVWRATGGSILAGRLALADRIGFNIGGGFHHAFPNYGEGFCAIHDVAVAIRKMQKDGTVQRALIVDCDVHHGNGTAAIFAGDPNVFTLSIHQFNNYPTVKPPSSIDIHLEDGTSDTEYLQKLREAYTLAVESFRPELIFYVAGADPYMQDQLGGLALTLEGLLQRDRLIFETALRHRIPVAVTLAGGYAYDVEDTVTIHINTARAAAEALAGG